MKCLFYFMFKKYETNIIFIKDKQRTPVSGLIVD